MQSRLSAADEEHGAEITHLREQYVSQVAILDRYMVHGTWYMVKGALCIAAIPSDSLFNCDIVE
jgi:hypothetical protein